MSPYQRSTPLVFLPSQAQRRFPTGNIRYSSNKEAYPMERQRLKKFGEIPNPRGIIIFTIFFFHRTIFSLNSFLSTVYLFYCYLISLSLRVLLLVPQNVVRTFERVKNTNLIVATTKKHTYTLHNHNLRSNVRSNRWSDAVGSAL